MVLDNHSDLFLTNVTLECETACNNLFVKYHKKQSLREWNNIRTPLSAIAKNRLKLPEPAKQNPGFYLTLVRDFLFFFLVQRA